MVEVATIKDDYKADYLPLQKEWKTHSKELLLVGRLSYWLYWLSKTAEACKKSDERQTLFNLKNEGVRLLLKSNYTTLKKHVPEVTRKLCFKHYKMMKVSKQKTHIYLQKNRKRLLNCQFCQKGKEDHYSLYSLAVLNALDTEDRKLLYIFYTPYPLLKDAWPPLEELQPIKFYNGEFGTTRQTKGDNKPLEEGIFSTKLIVKKVNESYQKLEAYLAQ